MGGLEKIIPTHTNKLSGVNKAYIDISNGQKFELKMSNWPAQNKLLDVNKTYIDIGIGQKFELKMSNWLVLRLIQ